MRRGYQVLDTLAVKYPTLLLGSLSLDPLAGSALEGFGVVDGGAVFAVDGDRPSLSEIGEGLLSEIGEGLLDARPRGAEEGLEIALGEA